MLRQDTLTQASNVFAITDDSTNTIQDSLLIRMKSSRSLAYPNDAFNSVVLSVNPFVEALGIFINALSSSTKSFRSRNGYIIDDISTSVLRPIDKRKLWIQEKSSALHSLLITEEVESGIASQSEIFARKAIEDNRMLALQMINQVYIENVGNAHVQIGILHLSSHLDYSVGFPTLQTIALAALNDKNDDVKDYAVRCYENWNHIDGMRVLKTIHTDTKWLQDYIDDVIDSLSERLHGEVVA